MSLEREAHQKRTTRPLLPVGRAGSFSDMLGSASVSFNIAERCEAQRYGEALKAAVDLWLYERTGRLPHRQGEA